MKISRKKIARILKTATMLLAWLFFLGITLGLALFIYIDRTLPDPETITSRQVKESTKIYDRTGKVLLYDIYGEEKRTVIPWEQIPQSMKNAILAAEDNNFYIHGGFDYKGILRAFFKDLQSGSTGQGGSTITQQLVGNALVGREKNIIRKIRELILAIEVERHFSKDQIFWMYLNQIPYGSNAYGIESASQTFFAQHASELTIAQSALLASLVKATTYLSPYGTHTDELLARKDFILGRMRELGFISQTEYDQALKEKLVFNPPTDRLLAPHFVIMVQEYLTNKYGRDFVESGGFKITTTLDATLQNKAEALVEKYSKINNDKYKASNAALVAIDPKTGDIVTLIGSRNYFDITTNDGNYNVATAKRQPGSSFKPFAYAAAFQRGYPDSTVLFDLKTEFNPKCPANGLQKKSADGLDCYHPQNYDGMYRGPVTMRQSLAQSLNVPSVETLYLAGIPETIALAQRMGITTLTEPSRYGLSLVLGGAEVRLVDIVSAYSVFANDGIRNPWSFIQKIELSDGTILEQHTQTPERVLDSQVSRLVTDVLSDNNARAGVFGYTNSLYIPGRDVAAKTGTTQENRDAWVLGYTPSLAVGVWVGNNDNKSMTKAGAGISAAGPLWHDFMVSSLDASSPESFIRPDPINTNKIMLNGDFRSYGDSAVPSQVHTILYYIQKENPLGPPPQDASLDPQFNNWETVVRMHYEQ